MQGDAQSAIDNRMESYISSAAPQSASVLKSSGSLDDRTIEHPIS
ncbi:MULTISPECIES: hypothetical protein [unclassified Microcoleus]